MRRIPKLIAHLGPESRATPPGAAAVPATVCFRPSPQAGAAV